MHPYIHVPKDIKRKPRELYGKLGRPFRDGFNKRINVGCTLPPALAALITQEMQPRGFVSRSALIEEALNFYFISHPR